MIDFYSETTFKLDNEEAIVHWLEGVIEAEGFKVGDINYIFCDDDYLHKLNVEFLQHDTLTDIISFDYTVGKELHGDIFISVDRVADNAKMYGVDFLHELHRVMVHGVLHYCGFKDKKNAEKELMRTKENIHLKGLIAN